jgi:hypothetical protein
MDEKMLKVG